MRLLRHLYSCSKAVCDPSDNKAWASLCSWYFADMLDVGIFSLCQTKQNNVSSWVSLPMHIVYCAFYVRCLLIKTDSLMLFLLNYDCASNFSASVAVKINRMICVCLFARHRSCTFTFSLAGPQFLTVGPCWVGIWSFVTCPKILQPKCCGIEHCLYQLFVFSFSVDIFVLTCM